MEFKRFIYVYRWKDTGIPVYVGSAWDVHKRDLSHSTGGRSPFDRLISKCGRETFTLDTVAISVGLSKFTALKDSINLENFYIKKFKTLRDDNPSGYNFMLARLFYLSDEQLKISSIALSSMLIERNKKLANNPRYKMIHAKALKKMHNDPKWLAAVSRANKRKAATPEGQAQLANMLKNRAQNRHWKNSVRIANENRSKNPEFLAAIKKRNQSVAWKISQGENLHRRWHVARNISNPKCEFCCASK